MISSQLATVEAPSLIDRRFPAKVNSLCLGGKDHRSNPAPLNGIDVLGKNLSQSVYFDRA